MMQDILGTVELGEYTTDQEDPLSHISFNNSRCSLGKETVNSIYLQIFNVYKKDTARKIVREWEQLNITVNDTQEEKKKKNNNKNFNY